MYSPVALTEEEAAVAAAATNSSLRETGGAGAVADVAGGATKRSGDGKREFEDLGEGSLTLVHQRGVTTSTHANETDATRSGESVPARRTTRASCDGNHGEEMSAEVAADEQGHRVAVKGAPSGGNKENTTQNNNREAKQQSNSGKPGKRRGLRRSKPKSTRKQDETTADKGGGGRSNPDGCRRGPKWPSSLDSARDTHKGPTSPPRGGGGSERERGGSAKSRSGSPRGRRRRRRGTGHGGPRDAQAEWHLQAGDGKNAQGGVDSAAGDDRDTRRRTGQAEEAVAADEAGVGPDPIEAENMLQTLACLSTTLRRLSRGEDGEADGMANASAEQLEERILRSVSPSMETGGGGSLHQPTAR